MKREGNRLTLVVDDTRAVAFLTTLTARDAEISLLEPCPGSLRVTAVEGHLSAMMWSRGHGPNPLCDAGGGLTPFGTRKLEDALASYVRQAALFALHREALARALARIVGRLQARARRLGLLDDGALEVALAKLDEERRAGLSASSHRRRVELLGRRNAATRAIALGWPERLAEHVLAKHGVHIAPHRIAELARGFALAPG